MTSGCEQNRIKKFWRHGGKPKGKISSHLKTELQSETLVICVESYHVPQECAGAGFMEMVASPA